MKATGALPTEERVQRMNDHQWLWFYLNIKKEEQEKFELEEKRWKNRMDYLGWWINPKLAESVAAAKQNKNPNSNDNNKVLSEEEQIKQAPIGQSNIIVNGDTITNDVFEEELKKALKGSGSEETLTALPDSTNAGNQFESKDDFLKRVAGFQDIVQMQQNTNDIPIGIESYEELEKINNNEELIDEKTERQRLIEAGLNPDDIDFFEY